MARQVKHTITGEMIDYNSCYKVKVGSKNTFYLSEEDYKFHSKQKDTMNSARKAYRRLCFSMLGTWNKEEFYAGIEASFKFFSEKYPTEYLLAVLKECLISLEWVREKHFPDGRHKLNYMVKVLTGCLEDDIIEYRKTEANIREKEVDHKLMEASLTPVNRKPAVSIEEFL